MGKFGLAFRIFDLLSLAVIFIFQSFVLNYFLVDSFIKSPFSYLWVFADLFVFLVFLLTLYLAGCHYYQQKKLRQGAAPNSGDADMEKASVDEGSINASIGTQLERPSSRGSNSKLSNDASRISENSFPENYPWFTRLTNNFPLAYFSWIVYSAILIAKIVTLFRAEIPQKLQKEDFFGPQLFKFAIGVSALVFSLIVAVHKNTKLDPLRNTSLNNLCYRIALEILDSASFLTLLMPEESGHLMYSFQFENIILFFASLNLFLPSMTLYTLCSTGFGKKVAYPIELWYKVIHVVFVDGAFMIVRLYLWSMYSTDTAIFLIKNIYAIANFGRELPGDFQSFKKYFFKARPVNEIPPSENDSNPNPDMRLRPLNRRHQDQGSKQPSFNYNWRNRRNSASNRGLHGSMGSCQSSLVIASTSSETNGHALSFTNSDTVVQPQDNNSTRLRQQDEPLQPNSLEEALIPPTQLEKKMGDAASNLS